MRKCDELVSDKSCLNKAKDDEMLFVLLGRDPAAPATIRAWVAERIRLGRNVEGSQQTTEALACATTMEQEAKTSARVKTPPPPPAASEK